MARPPKIRISTNDKKEYARLVRNARSKIRRTAKTHGVDLTNEIDLPKLGEFTTRSGFNEWKDNVRSFTSRYNTDYQFVTNPYGVTKSKAEISQVKNRRRREIANAKKELKRIREKDVFYKGEKIGTVADTESHYKPATVTGVNVPKKFDFDKVVNERRWDEIVDVGKRRVDPEYYDHRKEIMRLNFIRNLEGSFNNEADEIVEFLRELTPEQFYDLYIQNEEFDFDVWDSEGNEHSGDFGDITKMRDIIMSWDYGESNKDLKPF